MHHAGYYAPAEAVEAPDPGADPVGDLTMHNIEVDPLTQDIVPSFNAGPRMFNLLVLAGHAGTGIPARALSMQQQQHAEGSYSENVHEVGRYIAEDGSDYWGVHVDERPNGDQIILASDRNTGLWIFNFSCETRSETGESAVLLRSGNRRQRWLKCRHESREKGRCHSRPFFHWPRRGLVRNEMPSHL